MKVEEVRQELMRLADEDYKAFHSRLLPGTENILGVRVPELRKLAKRMVILMQRRRCITRRICSAD